jgi:hypothetical protein
MNKRIVFIAFCMAIAACGQSANNDTPQQRAAQACETEAKTRIGEKTYELDIAALAANAKAVEDVWEMQAPIVISPGLRDEVKQTLECKVRVQQGKPDEVTYINFIF